MDDPKKLLVIISGSSGVGKDTIQNRLHEKLDKNGINVYNLQKYTTRPKRKSEALNSKYIHLSEEALNELEKKGEINGIHEAFGNLYGSDAQFCIQAGTNSVIIHNICTIPIVSIVTEEAKNKGLTCLKVFLKSNKEILMKRINDRTITVEDKALRIDKIKLQDEFLKTNLDIINKEFDLVLNNSKREELDENIDAIFNKIEVQLSIMKSKNGL